MAETQVQKIIRTADEVAFTSAKEVDQLAFMSKCFIQATLPHSNPGNVPLWWRKSGNYTLSIQPHFVPGSDGKPKNIGLPYGSIPRLVLAWANAEVVKTQSQELVLGKSLSEFMDKIAIEVSGGPRGGITRLKNQAIRLFSSKLSLTYEGTEGVDISNALLAKRSFFFWDTKKPEQQALWDSRVVLSDEFFNVLLQSPVPLDWRILKAVKRSPLALDLYMWLSYRMFSLDKPQSIKWETLAEQFGSNYTRIVDFRRYVRVNILKIKAVWQKLNVDFSGEEHLKLYPSPLLIETKLFKSTRK